MYSRVTLASQARHCKLGTREYGSGVFAAPVLIVRTHVCARSSRRAAQSHRPAGAGGAAEHPSSPHRRRAFDGHRERRYGRTVFPKRVAYRTRPGPYISGSVTPSCSCTRETQLLQRPFWPRTTDGAGGGGR